MRLSVVIVNWNTSELLDALLDSIREHPPAFEHEVIVVDNASSDFDPASFSSRHKDTKLIRNASNLGYAEGNNQGIQASSGDFILLLNPDTRVTAGAIDALVRFMESHPDAAAAGPKLVRPDGSTDRSVRGFPYPASIAWEFLGVAKLFPRSRIFAAYRMGWFDYTETAEVDQPMGSCLIVSRTAIEDVGLLDTDFPIFFNDVDWLYRAKRKGYKVYFTPDATVVHHGGASTSQVSRRIMIRESHKSLIRFYEKHFRDTMPAPLFWLVVACIRLGVLARS